MLNIEPPPSRALTCLNLTQAPALLPPTAGSYFQVHVTRLIYFYSDDRLHVDGYQLRHVLQWQPQTASSLICDERKKKRRTVDTIRHIAVRASEGVAQRQGNVKIDLHAVYWTGQPTCVALVLSHPDLNSDSCVGL